MSDNTPVTLADMERIISEVRDGQTNGFTYLDRERFGSIDAKLDFLVDGQREQRDVNKALHKRITDEIKDRNDAVIKLNTRITNTRYIAVAVSAFTGFIGGLFRVPTEWIKGG